MTENRDALIVDAGLTKASGRADCRASLRAYLEGLSERETNPPPREPEQAGESMSPTTRTIERMRYDGRARMRKRNPAAPVAEHLAKLKECNSFDEHNIDGDDAQIRRFGGGLGAGKEKRS